LYDVVNDPGEPRDFSAAKPALLNSLDKEWNRYASEVGVILTE